VRILAAIMLVAVVGLGLTGTLTYLVERDSVAGDVDAELVRQVEAARSVVEAAGADVFTSRDALASILAVVLPPENGSALGIVDGEPALVPGTDVAFSLVDTGVADRVVQEVADGSARIGTVVFEGSEIRYLGIPVIVDGADDEGIFVVGIDVTRELVATNRTLAIFAVVAGGTLLAVALAGWLVAGRLLQPIRRLRETAERITASDLQERIEVDGNDDVSRLTETVNAMLDRLDTALRAQRELLDDVRHELRTPLTIVRGHLELQDASDRGEVERTAELAIEELDRMSALVDGLAKLAEVRTTVLDPSDVDVAALTRDVVDLARVLPAHTWTATEIATGTVRADRRLLVQAWVQLADNAAKYAPPESAIELGSRMLEDTVELWVTDRGPGIPEAQRARIFERFARLPGTDAHGSGLGLALVDEIARQHGGTARVESAGAGSRFVLELPRGVVT
jgi:two-component system, OmpR family, sensor kinase